MRHYRTVRHAEGWGGSDAYYLSLPFKDLSCKHSAIWRLRARSFRTVMKLIQSHFPRAKTDDEQDRVPLSILELGAGNGWFSWRLAQRGHFVVAADISLDDEDGLGALERYGRHNPAARARITVAQSDMESIPLGDAQFDVVAATGSLHYASLIERPVAEAYRLLRDDGVLVIFDSPTYDDEDTGKAMTHQRNALHASKYGSRNQRPSVGFLIHEDFMDLLRSAGFSSRSQPVFEGGARLARRLYCRLRGLAPPARFPVFVATKTREPMNP